MRKGKITWRRSRNARGCCSYCYIRKKRKKKGFYTEFLFFLFCYFLWFHRRPCRRRRRFCRRRRFRGACSFLRVFFIRPSEDIPLAPRNKLFCAFFLNRLKKFSTSPLPPFDLTRTVLTILAYVSLFDS